MGKPSHPLLDEGADVLSLHTHRGGSTSNNNFLDEDAPELQVDDLPPLYDDVAGGGEETSNAPLLPPDLHHSPTDGYHYFKDSSSGTEYHLSKDLDNDPKFLEKLVHEWAAKPPRVSARIQGSHQQTVDKNGKKEKETVTDFDIYVDITPFLYSDVTNRLSWREVNVVDNSTKAKRGTVFKQRAPGAKGGIEVGLPEKPSLEEWCHRYCASHSGLKCFTLERRMTGFDNHYIKEKLTSLVRGTNYRGCLWITFPVRDQYVHVYNESKINVWRRNRWIRWFCYLTFLWIFTWPYLFFFTKKFEVVTSDWPFSTVAQDGRKRYVSISEAQWYNMWGRAIHRAVLEKQQRTLDQQDLRTAEMPLPTFGNSVVDGAVGIIRAGIGAIGEMNRTTGWGYDS